MIEAIIVDLVLVLILVYATMSMRRRGLIEAFYKIITIVVSVFLVMSLSKPVADFISTTSLGASIDKIVYNKLIPDKIEPIPDTTEEAGDEENSINDAMEDSSQSGTTEESDKKNADSFNLTTLPSYITKNIKTSATNAAAPYVSDLIKQLLAAIIIYLFAKIFLYFVFLILEGFFSLPLLNATNKLLGAAVGLISGLFIVYLICGIASIDMVHIEQITKIVDSTYVTKFFYYNNLLMNFFV